MKKLSIATAALTTLVSCTNWQPVEAQAPTPQIQPQPERYIHPNRESAYVAAATRMKAIDAIGECETACKESPDNIPTETVQSIANAKAETQLGFDPYKNTTIRGTTCEDFLTPRGIFKICCAKACK
ncbi:hypothetical protein COU74_01410 [Candidatus Peregrinibacteria bacterium CG10_big_fil_rev_8_21_14_0_10_36_19]|nr:MAG: hypothetical protein COU74_01410 [Candidatus Peregrinibacteria bacterium CG10_big_fil_rev_8_21_14_0_10_36_19]